MQLTYLLTEQEEKLEAVPIQVLANKSNTKDLYLPWWNSLVNIKPANSADGGTGNQFQPYQNHISRHSLRSLPLTERLIASSNNAKDTQAERYAPDDANYCQIVTRWDVAVKPGWDKGAGHRNIVLCVGCVISRSDRNSELGIKHENDKTIDPEH